ncbi:hypothetical protein [Peribacillus deserti]|uniref:DUF1433 domain-containing protein n=1 Tax=Peribacillus deserti TaxID=673318 RepID=A0A2N5MBU0_9BACI|nr:hypothetical protein [Peribacillus deserti]PLT31807.1 hypothetical protein CUU66_01220 [Peribacillus deserti]
MKEQEILDTSEQVAIKYMKREYGLDFVVKSVEFTPMGVVDVDGYDKADKENEITVTINQGDNYDVSGVGYMKDLPNPKTLKEAD